MHTKQNNEVNFIDYHKRFVDIENLIVDKNFEEAETKLETLLLNYKPNFAKDYVILAQLCILNNHPEKFSKWIKESLKHGVKVECLKSIDLLKIKIKDKQWNTLEKEALKLHEIYNSKINLELAKSFNFNYQKEQNNKSNSNYRAIVTSNFKKIESLTLKGNYPSENLIGIDNSEFAENISDCDFDNSKITVTLLHYDYAFSELSENKLVEAIKQGQLHPREFAIIYTFEKNRISKLYKSSSKNRKKLPNYNFKFPFEKRKAERDKINSDRAKFGICSLETDKKKNTIENEYGIKLRFGYK